MNTPPVPTSATDRQTVEITAFDQKQYTVSFKPLTIFEQAEMELEINRLAPSQHNKGSLKKAIIDSIEDDNLILEADKSGVIELLGYYFDDQEKSSDEEPELTPKQHRQAAEVILKIQLTNENVKSVHASFSHRMNIQSLYAAIYTIDRVTDKSGEEINLDRKNGILTDQSLTVLKNSIGLAAFNTVIINAFYNCYMSSQTAKN